jgi:hypothetical protein
LIFTRPFLSGTFFQKETATNRPKHNIHAAGFLRDGKDEGLFCVSDHIRDSGTLKILFA